MRGSCVIPRQVVQVLSICEHKVSALCDGELKEAVRLIASERCFR